MTTRITEGIELAEGMLAGIELRVMNSELALRLEQIVVDVSFFFIRM